MKNINKTLPFELVLREQSSLHRVNATFPACRSGATQGDTWKCEQDCLQLSLAIDERGSDSREACHLAGFYPPAPHLVS